MQAARFHQTVEGAAGRLVAELVLQSKTDLRGQGAWPKAPFVACAHRLAVAWPGGNNKVLHAGARRSSGELM